nr:MAG: replication initiator protein [Microvirus sp.]
MPCISPLIAHQTHPGAPVKIIAGWRKALHDVNIGLAGNLALPCGTCSQCRLERARQWAMRIVSEVQFHPAGTSWFLTLTYRDNALPPKITGSDRHTLYPSHLQKFWKMLRKTQKIRYFACGEYGERTLRPHYHACVFNLNLTDLQPLSGSSVSNQAYDPLDPFHTPPVGLRFSPLLNKLWGRGMVALGSVTFDSASYVANYAQKRLYGKKKPIHETYQAEFSRCSLKPAIGDPAFKKFVLTDFINGIYTLPDGTRCSIPKRWLGLLKDGYPDAYESVRTQREKNLRPLTAQELHALELNRRPGLLTERNSQ